MARTTTAIVSPHLTRQLVVDFIEGKPEAELVLRQSLTNALRHADGEALRRACGVRFQGGALVQPVELWVLDQLASLWWTGGTPLASVSFEWHSNMGAFGTMVHSIRSAIGSTVLGS